MGYAKALDGDQRLHRLAYAMLPPYAASALARISAVARRVGCDVVHAHWALPSGAIAAAASLALYGVLQAVDGVALKQAVDAWARAPEADKAARFATAEAVRWLEWAIRSYHSLMLGLALVLCAAAIVWTARARGVIGYLMGLSGLAYLVQSWILGSEGFSARLTLPQLLGYVLVAHPQFR
jgi:hypothetical protein